VTERKPRGLSFEGWAERQIREARERGAFDNLPGTGKPLPRTDADELAWVRNKLRREELPVAALLPESLALAKEVEELPVALARLSTEARVRAVLTDLNRRIDAAWRGPQVGPPMRTRKLDVEAWLARWRAARPPAAATPPEGSGQLLPARTDRPASPRHRWWRRRG